MSVNARCQNYRRARQDLDLGFGIKHRNMTNASSRTQAEPMLHLSEDHTYDCTMRSIPKACLNVEQLDFGLVQVGALEPLAYGRLLGWILYWQVVSSQPQLELNFDSIRLHEPLASRSTQPLSNHSDKLKFDPRAPARSRLDSLSVFFIQRNSTHWDWLGFDVTPLPALRYLDDSHLMNSPPSRPELTAKFYQRGLNAKVQNARLRWLGGASRAQGVDLVWRVRVTSASALIKRHDQPIQWLIARASGAQRALRVYLGVARTEDRLRARVGELGLGLGQRVEGWIRSRAYGEYRRTSPSISSPAPPPLPASPQQRLLLLPIRRRSTDSAPIAQKGVRMREGEKKGAYAVHVLAERDELEGAA
ncbi:hypothetical protein B0H13DRAFT_1936672 [Mycena leptocephala]|nr:hypothetical protein B0H13DRAFT_1936672 [Mycena leptocephala]